MIVDAHAHLGKLQSVKMEGDADFLVKVADQAGVDKLCISSFKALWYDFFEGNNDVIEAVRRFPDRILGYLVVNPYFGEAAEQEFERCIKVPGMIGVKLYPPSHNYHVEDPCLFPIVEKAVRLKVPILIHVDPIEELVRLADFFPEARIIAAHHANYIGAVWYAKKYENILLDTTGSPMNIGIIEKAVEVIGAERIVYGSDLPMFDLFTQLAKIKNSEIDDEAKQLILGENMAKLLQLEKK